MCSNAIYLPLEKAFKKQRKNIEEQWKASWPFTIFRLTLSANIYIWAKSKLKIEDEFPKGIEDIFLKVQWNQETINELKNLI